MILSSPSLLKLQELLKQESAILIEGLWESPKAALLAQIFKTAQKNILFISTEMKEVKILEDLTLFGQFPIFEFPSWETLPEEKILPSPDIVGKRLEILHRLSMATEPHILFCPLQAALQPLPSLHSIQASCCTWRVGDEVAFSSLPKKLAHLGYRKEVVTTDKGEFSLRGGILDLFPISSKEPFRLDFFGDQIERIRTFDPSSQKSTGRVASFFLEPASEIDLLKKESAPATLFDYLKEKTLIIFDELLDIEDRYIALKKSPSLLTFERLLKITAFLQKLFWTSYPIEELSEISGGKEQPLTFSLLNHTLTAKRWRHPFLHLNELFTPFDNRGAENPDELLLGLKRSLQDFDMTFLSSTESEERALKERLKESAVVLSERCSFQRGYLSSGFGFLDTPAVLFPMTELTKRFKTRRTPWRAASHTPAAEFHELALGDLVVHFHNGIGKYLGTEEKINHLNLKSEFLVIEYAEGSKLFVPISQSYLVSRYIGAKDELPSLHLLGSKRWQRTKEKSQKALVGYAQDLLRLQASRELHGGFSFPEESLDFNLFEEEFPFEETEDQKAAILKIKEEMASSRAMDRLVCGDVGYGKTEVAMRAAFKAVVDGKKQAAVLVPTTVLALQHFETFSERMANFPVVIRMISRFRTQKEIQETLKGVKEGSVDILIGTSRLLSKDIAFKDLGLLIIDEEQRFGVRAKERLKNLKLGVDCLALSATPIPRTLYLSLIGAKAISTINTPPYDRLPIKTIIAERSDSLIQTALLRELARDGQAFFIHNRVESIYHVSSEIQRLLPEAKILTAHGRMAAEEIDAIFHAFKAKEAQILVSTTIIENGIDIPNANTILIDRAHQFGLADLYQLRGRVGRWNRPAYAYFLLPEKRLLPEIVKRRLNALVEASGFGGGIKIAMRDLEIRGAGDILGTEQSGHVSSIGFHLYCKLLKRTIEALRKKSSPTFTETKLEISFDARLPEEYVSDASLRMELYHRLGEATSLQEVDALLEEIRDRFGPPPDPVIWLTRMARLRILANQRGLSLLKIEPRTLTLHTQGGEKRSWPMIQKQDPAAVEEYVVKMLETLPVREV